MSKLSRWLKREKINAVFENDLVKFLKSLKIHDEIVAGNVKCGVCENTITLTNIQCIYPEKGGIRVCCDNPHCYKMILEKQIK